MKMQPVDSVQVLTNEGKLTAMTYWADGGLAVTRTVVFGVTGYTVTHIASGYRVSELVKSIPRAMKAAEKMLPLADWTQPSKVLLDCPSLKADIAKIRDSIWYGKWLPE